jgi:hypothetical protein
MIKTECTNNYWALTEKKTKKIIEEPWKDLEDENLCVKHDMADELERIGLPARAVSRLLNINNYRR